MASLRDVLNHIGKPVQVLRAGAIVGTVLGTERGGIVLLEAKVEPHVGDELHLADGRRVRVAAVESESVRGKVDHYRARVSLL